MRTFKQFLSEASIYAKKLGPVPEFTPALAEGNYRVGKVSFSAEDGLGAVPFNQSVYYHGLVALCRPSVFTRIALDDGGAQDKTATDLVKLINDGYALGIPFISINLDGVKEGLPPKCTGHEGRGRMKAIKMLNGDEPVPIHVLLDGGMRARHLTPELIKAIKEHIEVQGSTRVLNAPFDGAFVNEKAV